MGSFQSSDITSPSTSASESTDIQTQARQLMQGARQRQALLEESTLKQRIGEVGKIRQYLLDNRESILDRVIPETGKCRTDALIAEILGVVDYLTWLEKNAYRFLQDQKIPTPITLLGKKSRIYHQPLGVVLIIAPWNYPVHTAITSIMAAFVAGNAILYKPSEITPLNGLIEQILSASEPVANSTIIAYGDGALGRALIDCQPDKIFFTGSTRTGKLIAKQAAESLIPVDLELGGKDAMIVFDDAPLDRPVAAAIWGAFTHSGQSCSAVERLYVHENIYDEFVDKLKQAMSNLHIAEGKKDSDMGRMTVQFQLDIVQQHVNDAVKKGAQLFQAGSINGPADRVFQPALLTNVSNEMKVMTEETFGPVLPVMKFSTEQAVIEAANDSPYGLCGSIFTRSAPRAERIARALDVGGISINNVNMSEGNPGMAFGGTKQTGTGRIRGKEGLRAFTRSKSVLIDKPSNGIEANWYPYTEAKYHKFNQFIDALYQNRWLKLPRIALHGLGLERLAQKSRRDLTKGN